MRFSVVVLGLVGLVACEDGGFGTVGMGGSGVSPTGPVAMDEGMLAYSVGVGVETHGVHLPANQEWSVAGMGGLTCQLDMNGGFTGTDINVDPEDETIEDGDGGRVLVMTGAGSHQIVEFPSGNFGESYTVEGGVASRLTTQGHVDLAWTDNACAVTWNTRTSTVAVQIPPAYCAGGDMVVANDGSVWVGAAESVAHVTSEGMEAVAVPGRTLAYDADSDTVVATGAGSLAGVAADGTVAWRVDAGGEIAGFDASSGFAAVSLVGPTPFDTEMVLFDVASGEELSRQLAQNVLPGRVVMNERFISVASDAQFDFFRY